MFGIDSPELLVIAIVALVVIGPKELPGLLKTWGKWMAQMRGMASEFRGHVDEMVRQSELDEVKKQLESSASGLDLKALDPTRQIRETIQDGMAEGQKAIADAKSALEQAPAEPVAEKPSEPVVEASAEPVAALPAEPEVAALATAEPQPQIAAPSPEPVVAETPPAPSGHASSEPVSDKSAKAAAE